MWLIKYILLTMTLTGLTMSMSSLTVIILYNILYTTQHSLSQYQTPPQWLKSHKEHKRLAQHQCHVTNQGEKCQSFLNVHVSCEYSHSYAREKRVVVSDLNNERLTFATLLSLKNHLTLGLRRVGHLVQFLYDNGSKWYQTDTTPSKTRLSWYDQFTVIAKPATGNMTQNKCRKKLHKPAQMHNEMFVCVSMQIRTEAVETRQTSQVSHRCLLPLLQ